MDFAMFKEELFKAAKDAGFSDYEVYCAGGGSFSASVFNGELREYKNTAHLGASFRGTYNGKMGYASTERLEADAIDFLVKSAAANAGIVEVSGGDEAELLYAGDEAYPEVDCYNDALDDVPAEQKIAAAFEMEKAAYAADGRIKSVDNSVLRTFGGEVAVANSLGLDVRFKSNYAYAYAVARAEENGQVKTGFDISASNDFSKLNFNETGRKAAHLAAAKLGASPVPSGKYAVIFNREAAGDMLETFAEMFYADKVQKGFSMLGGKLGGQIAADGITVIDDPLLSNAPGSAPFDSEGVAAHKKTVVQNGVLKTYLHNLKTARKDGVKSTGNGFKESIKSPVVVSVTNFYIAPSETPESGLMEAMCDGLLITSLAGLHSGANKTSGDFSLLADGYLVKGGKIVRPVEQITVAGNFLTMLRHITQVGCDLSFTTSGVASPCLLVSELDIAGL